MWRIQSLFTNIWNVKGSANWDSSFSAIPFVVSYESVFQISAVKSIFILDSLIIWMDLNSIPVFNIPACRNLIKLYCSSISRLLFEVSNYALCQQEAKKLKPKSQTQCRAGVTLRWTSIRLATMAYIYHTQQKENDFQCTALCSQCSRLVVLVVSWKEGRQFASPGCV